MISPGSKRRWPAKDVIERIASEEATRIGVDLGLILGTGERPTKKVLNARRKAMRRIIQLTGCSAVGLATIWGVGEESVRRALADAGPYDRSTMARLTNCHGTTRARAIAAGKDPNTISDLSAWKRLGAGRNAA